MSASTRKRLRNGTEEPHIDQVPPSKKLSRGIPEYCPTKETCTKPAAFYHEDAAIEERATIDYSIKITKEMAENGTAPRPVRVYADGIYDMFHSGHARQLMQAKCCFPKSQVYLIVGVCNDELTHDFKGMTVMNEKERYESLRHCRYVDEVVTDAPWSIDADYLEQNKIDFVAHDDLPYGSEDAEDIYKWIKDKGMFVATQRTEGISTTDVIARIIKDYDMYIRRNLERGYSPKELNISFMKEKRIKLQDKIGTIKNAIEDKRSEFLEKGNVMLQKWEEKSRDFIGNFVELFGRDGRINQWINEGREKVARAISPTHLLQDEDSNPSSSYSPPVKRSRLSLVEVETLTDDED